MYGRKDKGPRFATPGFEHPNNFVLFDDGADVFVRRIDNDESLTTNLVQYTKSPLSKECTNYTMTIVEITKGGGPTLNDEFVMVGLTNKCVPDNPMWTIDRSVRYHSNDGGVFNGGMGIKTYHTYNIGDKITCRLDYHGPDRCLINFLKNDRLVYRQWANLPPGQLYPTIGVSRTEAKLKVQWPTPGAGDIQIRTDLPSNWFGWTGIKRYDETMVVTLEEQDTELEREAYNIQCPTVLSQDFNYFEIEVLKIGSGKGEDKKGCCAIGLVSGNCEPFVMPGWTESSIGYHSDDGGILIESESKSEDSSKSAECQVGDKMGCGIVFPQIEASSFREPILVLVYFTKNGELVYKKRMRQPRGGFFPSVGFLNEDDSIKLDVTSKAPSSFQSNLSDTLNLADVSSDFRCSEVIHFKDLAADSAVFTLSLQEEHPQLIQYLRYPLLNIGDGFSIEVKLLQQNTEIQLGVSTKEHPMEGDFLGSSKTSCGYLLKLGSLAMKEGMRTVSAWSGKKDIISCYLDFKDDKIALISFEKQSGEMIGRASVSRESSDTPLLASVVASAGPCTMKMDWSRSIYNARYIERSWGDAETWIKGQGIKGDGNKLLLKSTDSYSFAACVQCRQPMLTGTSYFGIKLLGGDSFPGIGLSKSTTDVNNLLGSETGEVCFLPSKGELIVQNCKWSLKHAPTFKAGDTLHCGFVFAEADRVQQKGVVYFGHNNHVFYHCRFTTAHGGVYPTITMASKGCYAELLETSRAQPLADSLTSEWLNEEIMTGVEVSDGTHPSDYNDKVDHMPQNGLQIMSSEDKKKVVYISHTIRERTRVDPIISFLRKNYLNYVFETSTNCVELTDKQIAIDQCEFVLVLMSETYTLSHEMAMEYSLFAKPENGKKAKPILVAADPEMTWPPQNFFRNESVKKFPHVFVGKLSEKEGMYELLTMLDREMKKQFEHGSPKNNIVLHKMDADQQSIGSGTDGPHELGQYSMDESRLKAKKSGFCNIL